jgi:ADP-heptose:LPS heptosyltransferase
MQPIIVYGSENEKDIALKAKQFTKDALVIEKPFSIKEFAVLIKLANFFLGNDSFAGHVATSQNTISVIICGPTSGWFLENEKTFLVYKGLKCQPCNDPKHCKYNLACYKTLKHEEILDKITDFLKQALYCKP